jgi:S1-C subfamily serine protease
MSDTLSTVDDRVTILGIEMRRGDKVELGSHESFRDWLMPVVIAVDGQLRVNGTAVCIGPGTFVTARHVVDYLLDERPEQEDAGVWVAWTEDEVPGCKPTTFHGHLMAVKRYRKHPRVDLAILTTTIPPGAAGRHTTVPLTLRLPALAEHVVLLGYPNGTAVSDMTVDGPTNIVLEYPLAMSLGAITGYQDVWGPNPQNPRSWPGVETDASMPSAMSGGAVIDRTNRLIGFSSSSHKPNPPAYMDWNGYVNLAGYLLDMEVDEIKPDGSMTPTGIVDLVRDSAIPCLVDPLTFDVDAETGPTYLFPSA